MTAFTEAFRLNEAQSKCRGLVTNLVSVLVINPLVLTARYLTEEPACRP